MFVWWNDDLVSEREASIPVTSATFLRGEGVFETIRAVDGIPLYWDDHYRRLNASAERLYLSVPGEDLLRDRIEKLLEANQLKAARLRVTVGDGCLISAEALGTEIEGASVSTMGERFPINERSPLAGVKCTSYAENITLLKLSGVDEALRPNTREELCEGCISNVFFVKAGQVYTPALDTGCLAGVMRRQIMKRIDVLEGRWPFKILTEVDEIWLSNAIRRLRFVRELDGSPMNGPSELFRKVRSLIP